MIDLDTVGEYAWGATMLAFLYYQLAYYSWGTNSLGGFLPFL